MTIVGCGWVILGLLGGSVLLDLIETYCIEFKISHKF